ncbi:MAG: hypothetical protein WCR52_05955 [Bacteroidota bacterium]
MSKNPLHQIETALHDLRSPKRAHTFWGFWAVLILTFVILYPRHSAWMGYPNRWMIGESVDGFKNYMTTAWHVSRDSAYVHYRGMNYPFGEHILFTDMQPIFAMSMQWWNWHISSIGDKTVAIMNILLFASLLFGAGVLFLLFRKLHLPVWYAGLVSMAILFLSPQYNRFDGHFGLSHTWIIPLLLLLLSSYEERYSRRYQSLLIGILVWLAAQIHFYYFGMCALFLGAYTAFQLIMDPSMRNFRVRLSHLIVMVIVPFALLNLWIHWANYSPDRPANPAGFTTYIAYWEGVFLPYQDFPLHQWIDKHIIKIRNVDFEAQEYAGLIAFFFTLYLLLSGFKMFGKSWSESAYHRVHKGYLKGIFAAALCLLIFSLGFPFAIPGMDWMLDYMGPLRQFRGLGRFTWPYYYVINVLAFYVFWNVSTRFKGFRGGKAVWFKWVIAFAPLLLLAYEAYTFQRMKKLILTPNMAMRSIAAPTPDHWLNKVDFSKYQALMPIPYFHIGSENVILDLDFWLYKKMYYTALHSGTPDLAVNLSRTPVSQMTKSIELSLPPCEPPEILDDFPDNRPIALMIEPKHADETWGPYQHLIAKAKVVYDTPEMRIMSIELDSIRANQREVSKGILDEMNRNAVYDAGAGWKSDRPSFFYRRLSYDSLTNTPFIFQGKGAYEGRFHDTTQIWNARLPKGNYYISAWLKADKDMGIHQEIKIRESSLADGHEIHVKHEGLRFYLRRIVHGWALVDLAFDVYEDNSNVRIFLPPQPVAGTFYLDEIMIKTAAFSVYRKEPGWVVRNNFWYKLD